MTLLTIVALALAAYRITALVTTDSLTVGLRSAVGRWAWVDPDAAVPVDKGRPWRGYVDELVGCPQCTGVWVSAGVLGWWWLNVAPWAIYLAALAGAQSLFAHYARRG